MQHAYACQRLFSNKIPSGEESDRGFLAIIGNNSQLCAATLKIEDGVGGFSLRKEGLLFPSLTILRPSPALAKKASVSNAGFSCSSINNTPPKRIAAWQNMAHNRVCWF